MNNLETGGAAFPVTLRDYFAAKALQGVLANPGSIFTPSMQQKKEGITWAMICASECFEIADAMIAERLTK